MPWLSPGWDISSQEAEQVFLSGLDYHCRSE